MPSISQCPICHRDITLPSSTQPASLLRCPSCDAQFQGADALAHCAACPPEAILIEPASPEDAGQAAAGAMTAATNLQPAAATSGDEPLVAPHDLPLATGPVPAAAAPVSIEPASLEPGAGPSEFNWSALGAGKGAVDVAPQIAGAAAGEGEAASSLSAHGADARPEEAEDEIADVEEGARSVDESAPGAAERAEEGEAATQGQGFSLGGSGGSFQIQANARPAQRSIGMVGQLVGMVGGAAIGLAIGYYVLLWIGGPPADFLNVIPKLPRWLSPSSRSSRAATDRPAPHAPGAERSLADLLEAAPADASPADASPLGEPTAPVADAATPSAVSDPLVVPANYAQPESSARPVAAEMAKPELGPRRFTAVTGEELEATMRRVGATVGCPACNSTGKRPHSAVSPISLKAAPTSSRPAVCEVCQGRPNGKLTTDAYDALCQLGEAVTFVQLDPDDPLRETCRDSVKQLLASAVHDRGRAQVAGRLAGARLANGQRRANGVLLAGTVTSAVTAGDLYELRLVLLGEPRAVTVLCWQAPTPALAPRDRVLILGSIVDNPRDNVGGYRGDLPQVVWGGVAVLLSSGE